MTKPFTPRQKFRILVRFDAQIIEAGTLTRGSSYAYGTDNDTKRFRMLRRTLNCAVRCACGCGVWAPLSAIDFDHEIPHAQSQRSLTKDGRPLRRTPCHHAKNAIEQKVTGKVTRTKRKLRIQPTKGGLTHPQDRQVRGWRSLTHPTLKRTFSGKVERRAP